MEPQDFSKDLVIAVAGYGTTTKANLHECMDNYVFGSLDGREAEMIVPYHYVDIDGKMPKGMELFLNYAKEGEFPYLAIVGKDGHKTISHAKDTVEVATEGVMPDPGSEGASFALETMFDELLKAHKDGKETVFVMLYDHENERDIDTIGIAKNYQWLRTLNLSQGMVDAFENYESTEDMLKRQAAEKEFAEKKALADAELKAQEAADKPAKAPRKRAAKKVAAKPLVAEDTPLTDDAPVSTGPNPYRAPLPTGKLSVEEKKDLQYAAVMPDGLIEELDALADHPGGLEEFQAQLDKDEPKIGDKVKVGELEFVKVGDNPFSDKTAPENLKPAVFTSQNLPGTSDAWSDSSATIVVKKQDLTDLAQGVNLVINALTNMMGN